MRTGLIIGGFALGVGILGYLATRRPVISPEIPGAGASLDIEIVPVEGKVYESPSSVTLDEGRSYTVRVSVTNTSTRAGTPWEAALEMTIYAYYDTTYPIPVTSTGKITYQPGEKKTFTYSLSLPVGSGGKSGAVVAGVYDPMGRHLATGSLSFGIRSAQVTYGALIEVTI